MRRKLLGAAAAAILLCMGVASLLTGQPGVSDPGTLQVTLRPNPDGTMSVLFRGVPGSSYQIKFTENTLDSPPTWKVAASGVVALAGWTEWLDTNSPAISPRFYQVLFESAGGTTAVVTNAPLDRFTAQEADDSRRLIKALKAGNYSAVLDILRRHGISEATLAAMASRLGQKPPPVALSEPFLKGFTLTAMGAGGAKESHGGATADRQLVTEAQALGYSHPLLVVDKLHQRDWARRGDRQRAMAPTSPIGVLNMSSRYGHEQVIRYFKWFDRYGGGLHSVCLNWYQLHNSGVHEHAEAKQAMGALCQLIKVRDPNRFVWLMVARSPDNSDLQWLQAMRLSYDGLLVHNVREFTSHFDETRKRYLPYVGQGTPMVVAGFCGYTSALGKAVKGKKGRRALSAGAWEAIGPQLTREEQHLQELGYRGLLLDRQVVEAAVEARNYKKP